ncbi:amidohydrolase [Pseudoalteromonas shioyasakiensis]|uniref:amidohydrolase n=1 Tax=Pseudoalteromonas shioyasakiensis TaxID=1190813 RepID=UPI002095A3B6|nr:amidohydrolase [Pseudoalteromonas shioyasakiensis]MCO6355518.1 amidohydrolase [Pseudoalteromonas shioyasakiensis]
MKKLALSLFAVGVLVSHSVQASNEQQRVSGYFDDLKKPAINIADNLWNWAEVGFQEHKSSELMQQTLKDAGFDIQSGVAGMPTAFVASYGDSGPVIGILAEMDALPGLSQDAQPAHSPIAGKQAGHACGHHLFAGGSVTAAMAIKRWLEETGTQGQVRVYGTPAEEGGAGKVYMVRDGLFDDVDIALHWHAGSQNNADATSSLANKGAKFRFKGIAAHAAVMPERGRSALDGVEAMNYMVNMMREHVPSDTRIHYVITNGGGAPNVVPEFAEVYYYLRTPRAADLAELWQRLENTAKAAALGTGTKAEWEVVSGVWDILPNMTLAHVMHESMSEFGGIEYSKKEQAFAEQIRPTLGKQAESIIGREKQIMPLSDEVHAGTYSSDVGDVSWNVPTAGLIASTWVPGTAFHSWQAVASGGTSIGHKGMILAAETLALSAVKLYQNPSLIEKAKAEFKQRKGDVKYYPQIGDRAPALDLRASKKD